MLIFNAKDVAQALPMRDAISGMKNAFSALQRGEVIMPPRTHISLEKHQATSLIMPSYVAGNEEALTVKVVGIFPNNLRHSLDRILGAVMVLDPQTGALAAVIDGASLTGIRTAAVSGAATDYLAKPDSQTLGIVGAGVQAKTHIQAMCEVRPIQRIKIYSPTRSKTERLISELRELTGLPSQIEVAKSGDEAVEDVDIVCTVTSSSQAVFSDSSIGAGTHINAIGSSQITAVEIPAATVVRAKVVVDQRTAAWEEAGDIMQPIQAGLIDRSHVISELGEITTGEQSTPRTGDEEITFFKSVGLAMQDAFAAKICLENGIRLGLGQSVNW